MTLVVEDDEVVAQLICSLLDDGTATCRMARTAEEGWRWLQDEAPGQAIVDLRLPGRDGWWLVRQIRADPALFRTPIVVITGFLEPEVEELAAATSCEWLGKPFTFPDLAGRLEGAGRLAAALPELPEPPG